MSLSRTDLLDEETVKELWAEAGTRTDVTQSAFGVWILVTQGHGTADESNIFLGDVTAALDHFTEFSGHENSMSLAFRDRLLAGPVD